jgi:hypothetical protein
MSKKEWSPLLFFDFWVVYYNACPCYKKKWRGRGMGSQQREREREREISSLF